jgi:hypothetical protein
LEPSPRTHKPTGLAFCPKQIVTEPLFPAKALSHSFAKVKGKYRKFTGAAGFRQAHLQKNDAGWPQKLTRTCSGAAFCGQAPKFFCVPAPVQRRGFAFIVCHLFWTEY